MTRRTDTGGAPGRRTATLAVVLVLLAGCSDDDNGASPQSSIAPTTAAPTTTTTAAPATSPPETSAAAPPTPAPTSAPTSTSSPVTTVARDFSAIDPIVKGFVEQHGLNGAGLIVVDRNDGIVDEQYWGDFGPDRISLIASSSKMITAGVLLRLQDEGLLDIDAPVAAVAPWGSAHPTITP